MKSNALLRIVTNPWVFLATFCMFLALVFSEFTPYAPGSQVFKLGLVGSMMGGGTIFFLIAVGRGKQ
jgi:hypothetical protein